MSTRLSADATLGDLRSSAPDQIAFARKALGVMHRVRKDYGAVVLRMGVSGTGQLPNYRFEDERGAVVVAIDGNNHQPWPSESNVNDANTWSTATMTYEDVQGVIARLTVR